MVDQAGVSAEEAYFPLPSHPPLDIPPVLKHSDRLSSRTAALREFIIKHYLPIIFAVAITFALVWPTPGKHVVGIVVLDNVHIVQDVCMAFVFLISGLALNTKELQKAAGHKLAIAYGFLAILIITPCLGFALKEIPLQPVEFSIGLAIFCVAPTTLGVGVALVRSCQGNEAIALLLTVATNILGVFTMPPQLKLLFLHSSIDEGLSVNVDILDLLIKLSITILVPSILGKALRDLWSPAESFAKRYRTELSLFSTTLLAFIIWQTLSGARDALFSSQGSMIVAVITISCCVHIFYLALNFVVVCLIMKVPAVEAAALVIMTSQKSAPVAVTVISYMMHDPAKQGLMAIPAIVGQISQIFIGAALVPWISKHTNAAISHQSKATIVAPGKV